MAEFVEVMKQRKRMCEHFDGLIDCQSCPLGKAVYSANLSKNMEFCRLFVVSHPQEAEEIIMKWVEENPGKSNADKFREVFGLDIAKNPHSCLGIKCPDEQITCYGCAYDEFWDKEYKEPKGDK